MTPTNDFDFICGQWNMIHRKLRERLVGSQDWITFEATYESRHVMGGMGNMDEVTVSNGEKPFYGMSMRLFNPNNGEWTIYWADNHHPDIGQKVQVIGKFEGKVGTFYGEEMYKGKLVKLRFIWESKSADQAYWEQAYLDEKTGKWEVNWTMDFTRA